VCAGSAGRNTRSSAKTGRLRLQGSTMSPELGKHVEPCGASAEAPQGSTPEIRLLAVRCPALGRRQGLARRAQLGRRAGEAARRLPGLGSFGSSVLDAEGRVRVAARQLPGTAEWPPDCKARRAMSGPASGQPGQGCWAATGGMRRLGPCGGAEAFRDSWPSRNPVEFRDRGSADPCSAVSRKGGAACPVAAGRPGPGIPPRGP